MCLCAWCILQAGCLGLLSHLARGLGLLGLLRGRDLNRPRSRFGLCGTRGATKRALCLWFVSFRLMTCRLLESGHLLESLEKYLSQVPDNFLRNIANYGTDGHVTSEEQCVGCEVCHGVRQQGFYPLLMFKNFSRCGLDRGSGVGVLHSVIQHHKEIKEGVSARPRIPRASVFLLGTIKGTIP